MGNKISYNMSSTQRTLTRENNACVKVEWIEEREKNEFKMKLAEMQIMLDNLNKTQKRARKKFIIYLVH
jgi:hypothetical protein